MLKFPIIDDEMGIPVIGTGTILLVNVLEILVAFLLPIGLMAPPLGDDGLNIGDVRGL